MSAGLVALLDDVAAIAKAAAASIDDVAGAAAKASGKAIGVVVDDTAVTPQYLNGVTPARELPMVARIARGSLINKAVITTLALVLNYFLPQAFTPILMLGGAYLCFEAGEKVLERLFRHHAVKEADTPVLEQGVDAEKRIVSSAIRTDLILSTEIMLVALNEVRGQSLGIEVASLIVVAIIITVMVYGVVALIVKMDDVGLAMSTHGKLGSTRRTGKILLRAMPIVLSVLSVVGVAAMLWVGGHLFFSGLADLGFTPIFHFMETAAHAAGQALPAIQGFAAWITETFLAMVFGLVLGAIITLIVWGIKALIAVLKGKKQD